MRGELLGVHEQACHAPVAATLDERHERKMPRVQGAHGGHETDGQALAPPRSDGDAKNRDGADDGQRRHEEGF
ncbi:MAG: hypothetical protein FD124_1471 [Alphaproteobacteria bacterium]|nr:MAG: hypothetical protein FD124_1471 [Alphaproteobacteria bacterium]